MDEAELFRLFPGADGRVDLFGKRVLHLQCHFGPEGMFEWPEEKRLPLFVSLVVFHADRVAPWRPLGRSRRLEGGPPRTDSRWLDSRAKFVLVPRGGAVR